MNHNITNEATMEESRMINNDEKLELELWIKWLQEMNNTNNKVA